MKYLFALLLLGVVPAPTIPTYDPQGHLISSPAPSASPVPIQPIPCQWLLDRMKLHHHGTLPKMQTREFIAELYATSLELHGFAPSNLHPQTISRPLLLQGAVDLVNCFGV